MHFSGSSVLKDVSCPLPPQMSISVVTCQRKWQEKEQRRGRFYFFTPLPEVKCVWTDVGIPMAMNKSWDVRSWNGHWPGASSLQAWPPGAPLPGPQLSPWPAHLPLPPLLPPLNTNSQLCCQAGAVRRPCAVSQSLAVTACPSRVKGKNKQGWQGSGSVLWDVTAFFAIC